jgi:hypothetical protein
VRKSERAWAWSFNGGLGSRQDVLLHEVAGTLLAPNGIPATSIDAFVGRDQRWPIRKSQDARRPIIAASPVCSNSGGSVIGGVESFLGLGLRHEPPVLNRQLRPHDADRVGGVAQIEAFAT